MYSPDLGVVEDKFVYVGMISKELKKIRDHVADLL